MDTSRSFRLMHASCAATKLLEHAVSIVTLGPRKSKNHDTLLLNILATVPVAAYLEGMSEVFHRDIVIIGGETADVDTSL